MAKIILYWVDIEDTKLAKEFDDKGGVSSFSSFVESHCDCKCKFIATDNQMDMEDDSWSFSFSDQTKLDDFLAQYNITQTKMPQKSTSQIKLKSSRKVKFRK